MRKLKVSFGIAILFPLEAMLRPTRLVLKSFNPDFIGRLYSRTCRNLFHLVTLVKGPGIFLEGMRCHYMEF